MLNVGEMTNVIPGEIAYGQIGNEKKGRVDATSPLRGRSRSGKVNSLTALVASSDNLLREIAEIVLHWG